MFQLRLLTLAVLTLMVYSCNNSKTQDSEKVKIVVTTGMIADAVESIVGELADVEALMGPGVDPHLYKATQGDLQALRKADIVVYNGLHLEGKMQEIFEELGKTKLVLNMSAGVSESRLIQSSNSGGNIQYDPHIWFDVALWKDAVEALCLPLMDALDKEGCTSSGLAYIKKLDSLQIEVQHTLLQIPKEDRVLITSHDAFEYFGKAYDFDVIGLQGISTAAEFGLKDITDMVKLIIDRNIKAVFVESSVSEKSIQAVVEGCNAKGHHVVMGGTLYSDAMGEPNTEEGTYPGMVLHNVVTIHKALNNQQQ